MAIRKVGNLRLSFMRALESPEDGVFYGSGQCVIRVIDDLGFYYILTYNIEKGELKGFADLKHLDGITKWQGNFRKGKLHGPEYFRYKDGSLERIKIWTDGELISESFYDEGESEKTNKTKEMFEIF